MNLCHIKRSKCQVNNTCPSSKGLFSPDVPLFVGFAEQAAFEYSKKLLNKLKIENDLSTKQ